jgi:Domain of unknown function (DUF4260)
MDKEVEMTTMRALTVERLPRFLLHLEGVAIAGAALVLYFWADHPWWLFLLLALAPDLAIAAYALGPRIGAAAYDVVHTYALPLVLGAVGVVADSDAAVAVALIWLTHIGVDRALGYGLKYPSGFKDTHLQRV